MDIFFVSVAFCRHAVAKALFLQATSQRVNVVNEKYYPADARLLLMSDPNAANPERFANGSTVLTIEYRILES